MPRARSGDPAGSFLVLTELLGQIAGLAPWRGVVSQRWVSDNVCHLPSPLFPPPGGFWLGTCLETRLSGYGNPSSCCFSPSAINFWGNTTDLRGSPSGRACCRLKPAASLPGALRVPRRVPRPLRYGLHTNTLLLSRRCSQILQ